MNSEYVEVFDGFSDRQLVNILDNVYEDVKIYKTGIVTFKYQGVNYLVNNSYNDGSIQVIVSFGDIDDMSLRDINMWNSEKRFAKLYDDDGGTCLEINLEPGISKDYLLKAINRLTTLVFLFQLERFQKLNS